MTWRKTLTYWVCFLLLGGYWLAFERVPPAPAEKPVAKEKLLDVFLDEVQAVEIRRDARSVRAERRDERWRVVSPAGVEVPSDLIDALLSTVAERQESEVVAEDPSPETLEAFGLRASSQEIVLEMREGRVVAAEVGRRNPTRTAVYAKRKDANKVLLAGLNVQYYSDLLFDAAYPGGARGES